MPRNYLKATFAPPAGIIAVAASITCFASSASTHKPVVRQIASLAAPTPATAPAEVRALWVVRTSLTTPESIRHIVSVAKADHFNTLFVQVRGRGDAYYNSTLEPRAEELSNEPLSFDPLQEMINDAHAAGLKVHAWINACFVWGSPHPPLSPNHVLNAHPDWISRDNNGKFVTDDTPGCEGAFLSPANLAARRHIHDVYLEIAKNYDIDGIHFDYIRYGGGSYDYSRAMMTRFSAYMDDEIDDHDRAAMHARLKTDQHAYVHAYPDQFQQFRRDQVTNLVASISHDVKAIKPWLIVSAAVFADYDEAYHLKGQDWKLWLRKGYVDAVCPMAYSQSTAVMAAQIKDAVSCAQEAGRMVVAGIGAWRIPAESTIAKIDAARAIGANGESLFSYGGVTNDGATDAYLDKLGSTRFSADAPLPSMPWLGQRPSTASTSTVPTSTRG